MTLSRIVSEIQWDIAWKSQITPSLFGAPFGVTQPEFHSWVSCGKTRVMGLPGDDKRLMVSLAVSIQYTNVTDRQTDRRTPHDCKEALCIHVASRGKIRLIDWLIDWPERAAGVKPMDFTRLKLTEQLKRQRLTIRAYYTIPCDWLAVVTRLVCDVECTATRGALSWMTLNFTSFTTL